MSYQLNDNIKKLKPYTPITGEYDIRLDANESFIHLPLPIIQKATTLAMENPSNRYPDPYAVELCEVFGQLYKVNLDCVTAGNGSDELISLIVGTFFGKNDELVTLAQDFSMYRFYGDTFGVPISIYPKRDDLTIDVEALSYYANCAKVKGIIFSNPCNPTSLCLKKEDVIWLLESVNCLVIVDEAYMDFADESVIRLCEEYDNLIVLKTCSKAIGLASIRLGFAVANKVLTRALKAVKSPYNVNSITQSVGLAALSDVEYVNYCIHKIIRSRDHLYNGIMSLYAHHKAFEVVYHTTTNFVYIKTSYAKMIYEKLLKRSIAIRCMGGYLRISAGSRSENDAVLLAMSEILKEMEEQE